MGAITRALYVSYYSHLAMPDRLLSARFATLFCVVAHGYGITRVVCASAECSSCTCDCLVGHSASREALPEAPSLEDKATNTELCILRTMSRGLKDIHAPKVLRAPRRAQRALMPVSLHNIYTYTSSLDPYSSSSSSSSGSICLSAELLMSL